MKECKRCLLTEEIKDVKIGPDGQCNFCNLHDTLEKTYNPDDLYKVILDIKRRGRKSQYDCVLGISGGFDSSYLLDLLTGFGLRVLALHFDNGWDSPEAKANMDNMVRKTGVDYLVSSINHEQLNKLNLAFLKAGVSDADIPNDMAMSKIMFDVAEKNHIKTIINGHNFKYEGSTPLSWSYMDGKYIQSVAKHYNIDISSFPVLTFWDQIKYMLKGIKTVRLLYYIEHNKDKMKQYLTEKYGWKNYGGNHCENVYTEFVSYLLGIKFGIDKRIIYKSAELRSNFITREEAQNSLKNVVYFDVDKIERIEKALGVSIKEILDYPITSRDGFETYHKSFKRYKYLIWIGVKLGAFPYTFYKKYTK